jgi:hypothetical protein
VSPAVNGYPRPGLRDDSKEQHPPKKYASTTRVRTRAKNNIYIYYKNIYYIYILYISYEFTIYQSSTIHFVVCLGTQGCSCVGKKHGGVRVSSKVGKPTTIPTVLFSQVLPKKKKPSAPHLLGMALVPTTFQVS